MPKGSAMSLRHGPTVDELLGDSLIQAVMLADHVEPQALRTLLADTAVRIADARAEREPRSANLLFGRAPIDRRPAPRAMGAPRVRPTPPADPCGSALCC
jgi:hypothetical protein